MLRLLTPYLLWRTGEFGLYSERFRNNISKRSRSSYLTDSKTHQLSNETFNEITAMQ
jgi:hypothetical protein